MSGERSKGFNQYPGPSTQYQVPRTVLIDDIWILRDELTNYREFTIFVAEKGALAQLV